MCPGKRDWVLGAPLFERAEIRVPGVPETRIEGHSGKGGAFLNHVTLNGTEYHEVSVPHSVFSKGAHLVFAAT